MIRLRLVCAAPLLLLSACGAVDEGEPAGFGPGEAQDINDAAAMLDNGAIDANAVGDDASTRTSR